MKNTDRTVFCIECYEEICEYLKKGVFGDEESDKAIKSLKASNLAFRELMKRIKGAIKNGGKNNTSYVKAIVNDEEQFCLTHWKKTRSCLSVDEQREMMISSFKCLPPVSDLTRDDLARFSNKIENQYLKKVNKVYPYRHNGIKL